MTSEEKIEILKKYLNGTGMSQAELAGRMGVSVGTLSARLSGTVMKNSTWFWAKAAVATGLDFGMVKNKSLLPDYIVPTLYEQGNCVIAASVIKQVGKSKIISYLRDEHKLDCVFKVGEASRANIIEVARSRSGMALNGDSNS